MFMFNRYIHCLTLMGVFQMLFLIVYSKFVLISITCFEIFNALHLYSPLPRVELNA